MVGVLAGISVYLTSVISASNPSLAWVGAPWVLFISWGAWFSIGAKMKRLGKMIIALAGGVIFGVITIVVYAKILSPILGEPWALPATVFLIATTIVLLELTDWFEIAFVYFFSYAGYFAYLFGGFAGASINPIENPYTPAIYCLILLMAGVVFALANIFLKDAILGTENVPPERRTTVFDKE